MLVKTVPGSMSTQTSVLRMVPAWPRRIAYILEDTLNERNRQRFGVNFFLSRGVEVQVFDVSGLTLPEIPRDRSGYDKIHDISLTVACDTEIWRREALKLNDADLIISLVSTGVLDPRSIAIYRAIARSRRPYMILSSNAFPGWNRYRGERRLFHRRIVDVARRMGQINWQRSLVARIRPAWLGIPAASFVVYGGRRSRTSNLFIGPKTHEIWAHAMDYETVRTLKANPPPDTTTAVFIDEFHPFHPDLLGMGLSPPVTPEYYFDRLRTLFSRIEDELGLRVIVAACPRADYENRPGLFGSGRFGVREILRNSTARLVAQSRLVIAHRSTAIGFAIMFGKPVLQVATKISYRHSSQRPFFDAFSEALGKPIRFIDDLTNLDLSDAFTIRHDLYARYITDFIKDPSSSARGYWEIVFDALTTAREDVLLKSERVL
jgi:hypothetical protein